MTAFMVLVAACSSPAASPSTSVPSPQGSAFVAPTTAASAIDAVCEAGEGEGTVEYWGRFEPENFDRLVAPFKEKYDIEVTLLPGRPDEHAARIITESAAGRQVTADIVRADADLVALSDRELVAEDIVWTDYGVPEDLTNDIGAVRVQRLASGLGYNTDQVVEADLPATWEELLDPKWAGKKVQTDPRGIPFGGLAQSWGEEKTLDYATRFQEALDPLFVEGVTAGLTAVATGEAMISTHGRDAEVRELQAGGAPIEIHYLDLAPVSDSYASVLTDAQHPNAAKCLIAWMASDEGRAKILEVELKNNESIPPGMPDGTELVFVEGEAAVALDAEIRDKIAAIWAGG